MRLTLHIGHYKTGSTAVQEHFSRNRAAYRKQGLLYPKTGKVIRARRCHSGLAFQELHAAGRRVAKWYSATKEFNEFAAAKRKPLREAMLTEIAAKDTDHVFISTEEFIRFGGARGVPAARAEQLVGGFGAQAVHVVCYLRRPDHYLEAWYNQLIKAGRSPKRLAKSLDRFIPTVHVQFAAAIAFWAELPVVSNVSVRRYEEAKSDLIGDVVATIGAPDLGAAAKPMGRPDVNPRLPDQFVEFARRANRGSGGADRRAVNAVLSQLAEDPEIQSVPVYFLDLPARQRLLEVSRPIDRRLAALAGTGATFFADLDQMISIDPTAISDREAFRRWGRIAEAATRDKLLTPRKPISHGEAAVTAPSGSGS